VISLLSWVTSVKKIQTLRRENVLLVHYTFPRTLKKIEGTLFERWCYYQSSSHIWCLI